MPRNPNGLWNPVGAPVLCWLADAYHGLQHLIRQALADPDPTTGPGATAVLIAIVALVFAIAAFGIAVRTRHQTPRLNPV